MASQPAIGIEEKETTDTETKKSVRCRNCQHEITDPALAIQPHEHTFRNPVGYSFHVLCYSDAPGAVDAGGATGEFSWFPGYDWSLAICRQCHTHLGWWYRGKDRFAGLIAQRLIR